MNINQLFSPELFEQMVEEKMVTVREHEGYPLSIANYSDTAQFKNCWNDVTLNCRGLIFGRNGEVFARPWKKFFNLGDAKAPAIAFDHVAEVTDKMDGSLGIMYWYEGKPSIATRGSFHSTQAGWATRQIRRVSGLNREAIGRFTFLFEIIYPGNRIVIDYGNFEGLVLLGAVEIETGYVVGPYVAAAMLNWPGIVTRVMPYKSINDVLAAPDRENTEGYVIRVNNHMVKWKRPDYVELHKLISNLSEKSVWSGLEGGKTPDELCDGLPDEFHGFVRETSDRLLTAHRLMLREIKREFLVVKIALGYEGWTRKDFAMMVQGHHHKSYMFALLDEKDISPMIWQELKPKGDNEAST